MKKILITGGAGYIGSHVTNMLHQRGEYELLVYDRIFDGLLKKGNPKYIPISVPIVISDLADKDPLEATIADFKPDVVMHFAGSIEVRESMENQMKYYENNIINGVKLVEAMLSNGVSKIIFSSTAAVYGEPKNLPIKEDAPKEPNNYYGLSKLLFENYLNSRSKEINSICLRYFNAAGAGYGIGESHNPETHLIPLVLDAVKNDKEIKVFGAFHPTKDGTCIRDYIHVLDIAEAHILALEAVEHKSEKYNLGTGTGNTVFEVIEAAEKVTGKRIKKKLYAKRSGDPAALVASYDKIQNELGWKPKRDLHEIIESAWRWENSGKSHL